MNHYDESYGYEFWKKLQMPAVYCIAFEENRITLKCIQN